MRRFTIETDLPAFFSPEKCRSLSPWNLNAPFTLKLFLLRSFSLFLFGLFSNTSSSLDNDHPPLFQLDFSHLKSVSTDFYIGHNRLATLAGNSPIVSVILHVLNWLEKVNKVTSRRRFFFQHTTQSGERESQLGFGQVNLTDPANPVWSKIAN